MLASLKSAFDNMAEKLLIVLTTLPGEEAAEKLAAQLIENRLAACVHILPTGKSVYRWNAKVEIAVETTLLIKTAAGRYDALEKALIELHPHELPEIIAIPVEQGLAEYLRWIANETRILD